MMSENRFKLADDSSVRVVSGIIDNETKDLLFEIQLVDLLNEQQALISALKKENKQLKAEKNTPLPYVETGLKWARAEKKIGEQQAEIERLKKELDEKCP